MARHDENVELVQRGVDAYNRGDMQQVVEVFDPEVEVYTSPGLINAGTYRGHEGFLTWLTNWDEAWEEFRIEIEGIESVGDHHVIVDVLQRARGVGSGAEVEMRLVQLYEIRTGKVSRFHLYLDRDAALTAARRFTEDPDAAA